MRRKILLVGLGDLGAVLLEMLLRIPEDVEIVVGARSVERATPRCNLARLGAIAQGYAPQVRVVKVDLNCIEETASTLHREQPSIVLTTATMATWWLPDLLPAADAQEIRKAGFGVWLPVHLAPTMKLMQAARQAQYAGFVLTAPYPDLVNCVLGKVGMAPMSGIGNIAEMEPKVRLHTARALGVDVGDVQTRFVAHHALGRYLYRQDAPERDEIVPPFLLRVTYNGTDVTDRIDTREIVLTPEKISSGRATHWLTAASAMPLMRALLSESPTYLHAPGPSGLPGGYPVQVSESGVQLALGDISLDDARRTNEDSQPFDGVSCILEDGTVVLAAENVARLRSVLGACDSRIELASVHEQALELAARLKNYALRKGVNLL